MGEEIKRPGTELNDTALEQASGGLDAADAMESAMRMCDICAECRGDRYCNGGSQTRLRDFLLARGIAETFEQCPFLRSRK